MGCLLPVIAALQAPFGIDEDVGDVLDVADLPFSAANLEQRVVGGRFGIGRIEQQHAAMPGADNRPTSDIRFASSSPLARYFQQERLPLYLEGASLPSALKDEDARLALLGARLFIRLKGKERPLGWITLGSRLSGQPYTPQDLAFVENLCEQAALSIERAQTVSDLERRVQEMNALSRVSQGVNITLAFDDVLELIYAQTAQIIPAADFHITLYNKAIDYFFYGFCVENRDRVEVKENKPGIKSEGGFF